MNDDEKCMEECTRLQGCVKDSEELRCMAMELESLVDRKVDRIVGPEPQCEPSVEDICKEPDSDVDIMSFNISYTRGCISRMISQIRRL